MRRGQVRAPFPYPSPYTHEADPAAHAAHGAADHAAHHPSAAATSDSAFAALQTRGASARGMGVDQYTSTHTFESLPDGGHVRITTADADAVRAVHAFLAFQRADHRAH